MKQNLYLICLTICVSFFSRPAMGQHVPLNTGGAKYAFTLTDVDKVTLLKTTQDALDTYTDAFTLLDQRQNRVTTEAVNKFLLLFGGTAELVQDYEEYVPNDLVDKERYCGNVSNRMELEGIQVRMNKAVLEEIIDEDPFWVVVIKVEKDFFNYVTADDQVKTIGGGRLQDHVIQLDIPKNDITKFKIRKISRRCREGERCDVVAANYIRYVGSSLSVFQPFVVDKTYGGYLGENNGNGTLELETELGFSGGIDFFTNRLSPRDSEKKNIFLLAGLRFNYTRYTGKLTAYKFEASDTAFQSNSTNFQLYDRKGLNIEASEKITLGTIEVPLGLSFRLKRKQKYEVFLQTKLLPSYTILIGTGTLTGKGDYDATIDAANWSLLEDRATRPDSDPNIFDQDKTYGPFLGGVKRGLTGSTEPALNGFGLGAQLSPLVVFHFNNGNSNWSLLIGVDITYHFSPIFKYSQTSGILLKYPNNDGKSFNRPVNNDLSLFQHYFSKLTMIDAGFRLGLLHHFVDKP